MTSAIAKLSARDDLSYLPSVYTILGETLWDMPLVKDARFPLKPKRSHRHQAMKRLVLLDKDDNAKGVEGVVDRPLTSRRSQTFSTTIDVSSEEGAQRLK